MRAGVRTWGVALLSLSFVFLLPGEGVAAEKSKSRKRAVKEAKGLAEFTDSRGCRIRAAAPAVARFREIAAGGSVTWDGGCEKGYISGVGVLREEGAVSSGGRERLVVTHWSGVAIDGARAGRWKRESFARFADSQKRWVNAAWVTFEKGLSKGRAVPIKITRQEDYSPGFRKFAASGEDLAVRDEAPVVARTVRSSSVHQSYGADGLLEATNPGWHAGVPVSFPQQVTIELSRPATFGRIGLLAQDGNPDRAPKAYRIEISQDGLDWIGAGGANDACAPNAADGWREDALSKAVTARFVRLTVLSNCGHDHLLTLRGLRLLR